MTAPAAGGATLRERVSAWIAELDRRSDFRFLALALLPMTVLVLLPVSWNPNEEFNYILAHRSVNPDLYSPYTAIFDQANARFLFRSFSGAVVETIGFAATQVLLRLVMAALYAAAFAFLFSTLGVSALRALAIVVLFDFAGETLHGDDWLFEGAESKTYAYGAVIFAIGLGLRSRWWPAAALMVLATYLHFLVGGFWTLAFFLLAILRQMPVPRLLLFAGAYALAVAPLVVIVAFDQLGNAVAVAPGGPDPNVLYALRNPHHIAPFAVEAVTWTWVRGVVGAAFLIAVMTVLARRAPDRSLPLFALALLAYFFLASAIAFFDRDTHLLAKLYLFRPASLTLFLTIAIGVAFVDLWLPERFKPRLVATLTVIVCLGFAVQAALVAREYIVTRDFGGMAALIDVVQRASSRGEIVLIEPKAEKRQPYAGLARRFARPTLVSWKFVPINPADIMRWHDRLSYRDALFETGCVAPLAYPIRLIVVFDAETLSRMNSCGPVLWHGGEGAVIRVSDTFFPAAAE
ncbi:MAG: hypothetical protein GY791_17575 [Alphaproteobacteria bacterium]|nr:hypothetical protein [Alphaproteobacteria bacterium]